MTNAVILAEEYITPEFSQRMAAEIVRHSEALGQLLPPGSYLEDPKWREVLRSEIEGHTHVMVALWSECIAKEAADLRRTIARIRELVQ